MSNTVVPKKQDMGVQHPAMRHLDLFACLENNSLVEAEETLDVSYMSRSFCPSALPLRRQFERGSTTKREVTTFRRTDQWFSVSVSTKPIHIPGESGGENVHFGLPYGAKARLLILWMATQARALSHSSDRYMEIGRISEWLEEVGIAGNPDSVRSAKEQLVRLSVAEFTMSLTDRSRTRQDSYNLMDSVIFANEDLRAYRDGELGQVRFPLGLKLSTRAYEEFCGPAVIPVSTQALRTIANNAMAIDLYLYLSYRLPSIPPGETEMLTWKKLAKQFGAGETPSRFRLVFLPSLEKALLAYEGANVDIQDEGLVLRFSPPERKLFVVSGGSKRKSTPLLRTRTSNRVSAID
ncbi:MAG: replication protein RepA [Rhodospirillaceae bacterium]